MRFARGIEVGGSRCGVEARYFFWFGRLDESGVK